MWIPIQNPQYPIPMKVCWILVAGLLVFLMIWMRWTFPRLREDQLQSLAWRWLIPASLANIVVTATLKVAF